MTVTIRLRGTSSNREMAISKTANGESLKGGIFNPFPPKSDFIDFTLSNARRLYSSKGDPLGIKELK